MTLDDLRNIIASGEREIFEGKETTGQRTEAAKTLCAFLNGNGGSVAFGVSRKDVLTGQLVSDGTKRDLFEAFSKFEPEADIAVEWLDVDDTHKAIVCTVERGNVRPYVYDGRPYKRVQSSTTVMPQEEYERMLRARRGFQSDWETETNPELTLADLDENEIRKTARMGVAEGRLPDSTDINDIDALLDGFKVRKDGRLRNAAAVLFCKENTDYTQCLLRLARFKGVDREAFIDNKQIAGNVFRLIDAGMAFCFNHLSLSGEVIGTYREERLEVPAKAIREALVNALVHRQYERRGSSVSLAIYDDRIEIVNPGSFPPDLTMEKLLAGNESELRNPVIARVMYARRTLETWGRGVKLMVNECTAAGLPPPEILTDGGYVHIILKRPAPIRTILQGKDQGRQKNALAPNGMELAPNGMELAENGNGEPIFETGQIGSFRVVVGCSKFAEANGEERSQKTAEDAGKTSERAEKTAEDAGKTSERAGKTVKRAGKTEERAEKIRIWAIAAIPPDVRQDARANMASILMEIGKDPAVTTEKLQHLTGLSDRGVRKNIASLRSFGLLIRVGPDKGGHWELLGFER